MGVDELKSEIERLKNLLGDINAIAMFARQRGDAVLALKEIEALSERGITDPKGR